MLVIADFTRSLTAARFVERCEQRFNLIPHRVSPSYCEETARPY
jgi:hypothetical protein